MNNENISQNNNQNLHHSKWYLLVCVFSLYAFTIIMYICATILVMCPAIIAAIDDGSSWWAGMSIDKRTQLMVGSVVFGAISFVIAKLLKRLAKFHVKKYLNLYPNSKVLHYLEVLA